MADIIPEQQSGFLSRKINWARVSLITLISLVVIGLTASAFYVPEVTIYVPILALGLALALQKYTTSVFAYFVISTTKTYGVGDRIRIGNVKGDIRKIGLIHTTLEEVGEDEKLGGELTGRLLHLPNLLILDQPVLNYSKDYSIHFETISSDYLFDEVRIPITTDSNADKAVHLLERILKRHDQDCIIKASHMFQNGYPKFLDEAMTGPRVIVHIEPEHFWIKGKFVAPLRGRNDMRSRILLDFVKEVKNDPEIRLA
ncbi:MAG: mechanosensitive ion channel [Chloroflexota bacterium]|nr:mechanosensitive ion channel [Chloroflexota bacterium]